MSFIGVVEVFRQAQIEQSAALQLHAVPGGRASSSWSSPIPLARLTDWLVARDRRHRRRRGPAVSAPIGRRRSRRPALRDRGRSHKSFGRPRGAARHRPRASAEHEVVCLIGASGLGQVDAAALHQPARADRRRADRPRGRGDHRARASTSTAIRRRIGIVFQAFNLFPHMSVLDNVTLGAAQGARAAAARGGGARRPSCSSGSAWPTSGASTRTGCRAASSSASRSSGRWRCEPDLLLLDEITSALDPELVAEVLTSSASSPRAA